MQYYNEKTILYLDGEFETQLRQKWICIASRFIMAILCLKAFVLIKLPMAKQKFLKQRNITNVCKILQLAVNMPILMQPMN